MDTRMAHDRPGKSHPPQTNVKGPSGSAERQSAAADGAAASTASNSSTKAREGLPVSHTSIHGRATAEPLNLSSAARADTVVRPIIFVVDDDQQLREAVRLIFEAEGHDVRTFASAEDFLEDDGVKEEGCLLVDIHLPGMSGLDLLAALRPGGHTLPAIMITGSSDVSMVVVAMKSGALDFIEKPISRIDLLASVGRAIALSQGASAKRSMLDSAVRHIASLTKRQTQIMALVLAGQPSKNIAADLGISQRTVENHRAAIMKRTGSKSIPALARLALFVDDKG